MPDAGSPESGGMSDKDKELLRRLRESNYNQKPLPKEPEEEDDEGEIVSEPGNKPNMRRENETDVNLEKPLPGRSFNEIQTILKNMADAGISPQDTRVQKLQETRQVLIDRARAFGVFDDIKPQIQRIQNRVRVRNFSFEKAINEINEIDVATIERTATGSILTGREGKEYHWDPKLNGILREYVSGVTRVMRHALEEAQADLTEDADRQRDAANMQRKIDILNWGTIPEDWIYPLAREAAEREVKRQAPKQPQENDRVAQTFERIAPPGEVVRREFLKAERYGYKPNPSRISEESITEGLEDEDVKDFWKDRLQLAIARANKQAAFKPEDVFANQELMSLTLNSLENLTNWPKIEAGIPEIDVGVPEVICIYAALASNPDMARYIPGITDFVASTNQTELDNNRTAFSNYLENRFHLTKEQAITYEQIGYNFLYITNFIEENDLTRRGKLSSVRNSTVLDMMHPEAKLESSIKDGDIWPPNNVFGEWANRHPGRILGKPRFGKKTNMLPETLFKSFVNDTKSGFSPGDLVGQGTKLLSGEINRASINWNGAKETPFVGYQLKTVNNAILVFNAIFNGTLPPDRNYGSLRQAYKALGTVTRTTKETIVYILYSGKAGFIDPNSEKFSPRRSADFMKSFWHQFNKDHPGYFSE